MGCEKEEKTSPLLCVSRKTSGNATSAQTLGNIVVSILGTGALSLPYAFRVAGWLAGSIGFLITGLTTCYCMVLLVECRRKAEEDAQDTDTPAQTQTYGDIGAIAFGAPGRFLTEFLILVTHAGAAVAYLLFIAQNLSSLFTPSSSISIYSFIFFPLLPLELLLSFIRSLSFLAPFSAFATFCNVFAIAVVIKEDINQIKEYTFGSRSGVKGAWSIPFACGVAVFCFEGFGMTLPIEGSMEKPKKFCWVLIQAFVGIALVYICFGIFGYVAYGEETREIITLNLPDNWSAVIVKVGLCTAISFTFPFVVHPIHEIVELKLKSSKWFQNLCQNSQSKDWFCTQVARVVIVAALAMLTTLAPGFAQLISITGSTICALISFVLPASFHLKIMGSYIGLWRRLIDYVILVVGLVSALYGTYTAIQAAV